MQNIIILSYINTDVFYNKNVQNQKSAQKLKRRGKNKKRENVFLHPWM